MTNLIMVFVGYVLTGMVCLALTSTIACGILLKKFGDRVLSAMFGCAAKPGAAISINWKDSVAGLLLWPCKTMPEMIQYFLTIRDFCMDESNWKGEA